MSFDVLRKKMTSLADVNHAIAVLSWDQEVYMPEEGAAFRGQQIATLSGISHEKFTAKELQELVAALQNDASLSASQQREIAVIADDLAKSTKFTTAFVEKESLAVSEAFNAWQRAKQESDYTVFAPFLEKIIAIQREKADILGYEEHPYNALIDLYEPKMTVAELDTLFAAVKSGLKPLLSAIAAQPQHSDACLSQHFPKAQQVALTEMLLAKLGFNFKQGRQDISSHPFCTTFAPTDVRVTTRYDENDLANSVWSTIHECGHALYEQGLKPENYGMPSGSAVSLGIHESQSRLWENCIGRSQEFAAGFFPLFQTEFPTQFASVNAVDFYKAANVVKPSLIRTEADELTYHFHIMIRYEIEKEMIDGKLKTTEIKELWNAKYKEYLGIDVPNDAVGVLQDVHWSHGGIGYFPTYSLGSFYAAQWYYFAQKAIPDLLPSISKGETAALLTWLRKNIHSFGSLKTAKEISTDICGESLNFSYFLDYVTKKYSGLYQL